jgi:flagellar hook-associated protein 3 FlgL
MRVTNKMMADNITSQLSRLTEQMNKTQEQIVTGKRINRVSDDPSGISSVLSYRTTIAGLDQYNANIGNAKLHIDTVDSVLGMVGDLLRQAKDIANDTAPDMRAEMAQEVSALRDQLLQMANYQLDGKYVFNGDTTDTPPYNSGTWTYDSGDTGTKDVIIGENLSVGITADGSAIFGPDGNNIFDSLNRLETALNAGNATNIEAEISVLGSAVDRIITVRTQNAGVYKRLEATENHYSYFKVNVQEMLSKTEDTDIAEAIINFQVQQTTYESTLATSSMVLQKSLIDFLR